jgi:hypothetical protein
VTNEEIELFVDRLCGYWPTTNIARNTVKSAWRQSMPLRSISTKDGKQMLEKIKTMPGFPSLNTVEQLCQQVLKWEKPAADCPHCGNNLWLYVEPTTIRGYPYTQVVKCVCHGGSWEEVERHGGLHDPLAGLPPVNIELVRRLMAECGIGVVEALREAAS